jgi:hypothetical protein
MAAEPVESLASAEAMTAALRDGYWFPRRLPITVARCGEPDTYSEYHGSAYPRT